MKKLITLILIALLPLTGMAVTKNVTKESTDNRITENLVFGTGKSLTFDSGSTLDLSSATVTLPSSVVTLTGAQVLTNKTINGASNTLTVRAASDITGTLPFANGGTNATTQAGLRANASGVYSGLANQAAALAATPDYDGQWLSATDGFIGYSTSTAAGGNQPLFVIGTAQSYFLSPWQNNNTGHLFDWYGPARFGVSTITIPNTVSYQDNALNILNRSGGYSSVSMCSPTDGTLSPLTSRSLAIGFGPDGAGTYQGRAYIGIAPITSPGTTNPPDLIIAQEKNDGSGYLEHYRLLFDGTNHVLNSYGWDTAARIGPSGWTVASTGDVSVGHQTPLAVLHAKYRASASGTGTVTASYQSYTVTGTGTAFTTQLRVGGTITIGTFAYTIRTITSNTSLTTFEPSDGHTGASFTYINPVFKSESSAGYASMSGTGAWVLESAGGIANVCKFIIARTAGRAWSYGVGTDDKFYIQNDSTPNTQPFLIDTNAANDTIHATSAGAYITGTFNVGGAVGTANSILVGSSSITAEGSSADGNETTVTFTNPTADRAITIPDQAGTVLLSGADGPVMKTARVTTGSVAGSATALVTITWTTAFADTNYTVQASVVEATTSSLSMSVVHVESISASAVTVRVLNNAVGALTGVVHVTALHD